MALRRIVIERAAQGAKKHAGVTVDVYDDMPIGPLVATLAARFGYPLADSFGSPIVYRLRPLTGGNPLSKSARLADANVRAGSHFILEAETAANATVPIPELVSNTGGSGVHVSTPPRHFSRRPLLVTGSSFVLLSVLGLGTGMTTALAQRYLGRRSPPSSPAGTGVAAPAQPMLTMRATFTHHQQTVRTVSWSPDGTRLASGGNDAQAFIWQQDGTVLRTLRMKNLVRALAWSPDGIQLALGVGNTVAFFDARTGTLLAQNGLLHTAAVTALAWDQAGILRLISAGDDKKAVVWDGEAHQPQVIFRRHTAPILALAALSDTVATASEGGLIRVWSSLSGQEVHGYFSDTTQAQRAVAFASTGLLAVGGDGGVVRLWRDGRTCTQQKQDTFGAHCIDVAERLQAHAGSVQSTVFSPDGALLATGGDDGKLIIWSMQDMTPVVTQQLQDAVAAVAWSLSGQFLAVASGTQVTIWLLQR